MRAEWTDSTELTPLEQRSDPPLEIHTRPATAPAASSPPPPPRVLARAASPGRTQTATILVGAPDRQGITAGLAQLFESQGVRVRQADQHTDPHAKLFFQRLRVDLSTLTSDVPALEAGVRDVCTRYGMEYRLYGDRRRRVAILVSKQHHCLYDLLVRYRAAELNCEIAVIISNHPDAAPIAHHFGIPFRYMPVTDSTKREQERAVTQLLHDTRVELVVLARYMQILSPALVDHFPTRIINIHHSFLPAFVGANPYRQAYEKGVKLIGATSHYVTSELDQGPIIEQETVRCTHRDTVDDLVRKGRDLEKRVLAHAVRCHLEDRVMVYAGKTVVFD